MDTLSTLLGDPITLTEDELPYRSPHPGSLPDSLENLSVRFIEGGNKMTLDPELNRHLHATTFINTQLRGEPFPGSYKLNPRHHVAGLWEFASLASDWAVDSSNVSSTIDENAGIGYVFMSSKLTGYFGDLACERVCQLKWRRRRSIWRIVEVNLLGGHLPSR
jgi:hypothetical protein